LMFFVQLRIANASSRSACHDRHGCDLAHDHHVRGRVSERFQ